MLHPDELTSIVRGAQRLEDKAFERLVDLYSPRLYGFLLRITGNREDAEDLVQEVFVRVVRTIRDYSHNGRFEGWLFRIATNLGRDRIRHLRRHCDVGPFAERTGDDATAGNGSNPDVQELAAPQRRMEFAEDLDRLQAAIQRLSEDERYVILLRHYGHMSFPDIAELLEAPLGTVLARAHRGLGKLRQWMEPDA